MDNAKFTATGAKLDGFGRFSARFYPLKTRRKPRVPAHFALFSSRLSVCPEKKLGDINDL
jgi:hypothetical protein